MASTRSKQVPQQSEQTSATPTSCTSSDVSSTADDRMRLVRHFDALNAWDPVIPWDKSDTVVLVGKREGEPAIAVKEWSAERMQRGGGDIQLANELAMAGHAGLLDGFVTPLAHISDMRGMMVCYRHAGTNLEQFVEQHSLTNFEKKQLFCQLLMHLEQLHAMGMVHADLKPDNLLVDRHSRLRLADFGLCTRAGSPSVGWTMTWAARDLAHRVLSADGVPTRVFYSREHCAQAHGPGVDMYHAGLLLIWLLHGQLPPALDYDIAYEAAKRANMASDTIKETFLDEVSEFAWPKWIARNVAHPELAHLLAGLLAHEPQDRLTAADALSHAFLRTAREACDDRHSHAQVQWRRQHSAAKQSACDLLGHVQLVDAVQRGLVGVMPAQAASSSNGDDSSSDAASSGSGDTTALAKQRSALLAQVQRQEAEAAALAARAQRLKATLRAVVAHTRRGRRQQLFTAALRKRHAAMRMRALSRRLPQPSIGRGSSTTTNSPQTPPAAGDEMALPRSGAGSVHANADAEEREGSCSPAQGNNHGRAHRVCRLLLGCAGVAGVAGALLLGGGRLLRRI